MSLSKAPIFIRFVTVTAILGVSVLLSSCGYRPLYGTQANTPQTTKHLQSIQIKHIEDRTGQMMRTALKRRFHPVRTNSAPLYSLHITLAESLTELAVEKDASTTRANLQLTADFRLMRNADSAELYSGAARGVASYNLLTSFYATDSAQKDARNRAIEGVADQIRTQLAVYFQGPGLKQPPIGSKRTIQ